MVIADIDREGAAQAAAALADSGQDVEAMAVDIANVGWVAAFADEIRSHAGRVDILNNNAAATGPAHQAGDGNVMTLDLATWDDTMAVDLTGSMLMCRGLIPLMLPRGLDHQHDIELGAAGGPGPHCVRRGQGRAPAADPDHRHRVRPPWHPVQRNLAGPHRLAQLPRHRPCRRAGGPGGQLPSAPAGVGRRRGQRRRLHGLGRVVVHHRRSATGRRRCACAHADLRAAGRSASGLVPERLQPAVDRLRLRVGVNGLLATLAPVTRLLGAAEGHRRIGVGEGVDPHHP